LKELLSPEIYSVLTDRPLPFPSFFTVIYSFMGELEYGI